MHTALNRVWEPMLLARVDPATLSTLGRLQYADNIKGDLTTAHGSVIDGHLINITSGVCSFSISYVFVAPCERVTHASLCPFASCLAPVVSIGSVRRGCIIFILFLWGGHV